MERRAFFMAAVALAATGLIGSAAVAPPAPFRRWHRFDRVRDCWDRIEFENIRTGDVIWEEDSVLGNEVLLVSDSYDPATESFGVCYKIDKKTNQWIPVN